LLTRWRKSPGGARDCPTLDWFLCIFSSGLVNS
jgi:hypothetical protein